MDADSVEKEDFIHERFRIVNISIFKSVSWRISLKYDEKAMRRVGYFDILSESPKWTPGCMYIFAMREQAQWAVFDGDSISFSHLNRSEQRFGFLSYSEKVI